MEDGSKDHAPSVTHAAGAGKINFTLIVNAQKVLQFWFGELDNKEHFPVDKASMWFKNGADYDAIIRADFLSIHQQASSHQLDDWRLYPKSLLALIIVLDQFSRHLYRNTAQAFAQDKMAIECVIEGIKSNYDQDLYYVERQFFYMPLMHAEDITTQKLSVQMFKKLRDDVPDKLKEAYTNTLSFAESHQFVISKFGRFPELNDILGRESTKEEMAFLETGKYRFL